MDQILKTDEVARMLGAGTVTVYRMARKGKLPAFKVIGQWRFNRREIEYWVEQHTIRPAETKNRTI